jgi:hypothetical protein
MRERKLRNGVNWQGVLKQKGVTQGLGLLWYGVWTSTKWQQSKWGKNLTSGTICCDNRCHWCHSCRFQCYDRVSSI